MSEFYRHPIEHLRAVRRQVFGFGRSRAAAEKAEYRRGATTVKVIAEPVAMPEDVVEAVNFHARGWLVAAANFEKAGLGKPKVGDVLAIGGDAWVVFKAGGSCYGLRSNGKDFLLYTKLTGD